MGSVSVGARPWTCVQWAVPNGPVPRHSDSLPIDVALQLFTRPDTQKESTDSEETSADHRVKDDPRVIKDSSVR